jgi:hypothetical protein
MRLTNLESALLLRAKRCKVDSSGIFRALDPEFEVDTSLHHVDLFISKPLAFSNTQFQRSRGRQSLRALARRANRQGNRHTPPILLEMYSISQDGGKLRIVSELECHLTENGRRKAFCVVRAGRWF